ncbi:CRP-like cAMP-activated global transcriptional regulator [Amycolatopsis sp. CA-230715]|nr:CRP-like cAMP-activated global transcriptional regulator [Amycolatopsis sp. CA-230715]
MHDGNGGRPAFLHRLDAAARTRLRTLGTPQTFGKGNPLMRAGEPGDYVMLLESGFVKVSNLDSQGNTIILDIGVPGDLHGEIAVVAGQPRMATVVALEPVRARRIAATEFRRFLRGHVSAMEQVLVTVCGRFAVAQEQRTHIRGAQAMAKVARRLDHLLDICGVPGDGAWRVGVSLSQEELAQFVPLSRSNVAEALKSLERDGVIAKSRKALTVLDRPRLVALRQD